MLLGQLHRLAVVRFRRLRAWGIGMRGKLAEETERVRLVTAFTPLAHLLPAYSRGADETPNRGELKADPRRITELRLN